MNYRDKPALRELLAGQYVLGTLKGGARRRFEGWLHGDAALRRTTAEWQERLMPMAELTRPIEPPRRVWNALERRLRLGNSAPSWQFWRDDTASFWRPAGMAAMAATVVLAFTLLQSWNSTPRIDYVATLSDDKSQTALLVTADQRHHALQVRLAAGVAVAADKSLQLWAVPKQGAPRSLGVLPRSGVARFDLPASALSADVAVLAVSLEPLGGSPNPNAPSGPVVYKGGWVRAM